MTNVYKVIALMLTGITVAITGVLCFNVFVAKQDLQKIIKHEKHIRYTQTSQTNDNDNSVVSMTVPLNKDINKEVIYHVKVEQYERSSTE